jgi:hypothetical protein
MPKEPVPGAEAQPDAPDRKASANRKPVETHRDEAKTPAWAFAAAKQKHKWPVGAELTRAEYDRAIESARQEVIR